MIRSASTCTGGKSGREGKRTHAQACDDAVQTIMVVRNLVAVVADGLAKAPAGRATAATGLQAKAKKTLVGWHWEAHASTDG